MQLQLLHQIELKDIYQNYIRSIAEQSAVVWHSSLSGKNRQDIERIQKVAVRIIMGWNYKNYSLSLKALQLDTLKKRRDILSLRFAKNCLKNEKMKLLFPIKKSNHDMKTRNIRKFQTKRINSKRYEKSALPFMTKMLNFEEDRKRKILQLWQFSFQPDRQFVPVNSRKFPHVYHLRGYFLYHCVNKLYLLTYLLLRIIIRFFSFSSLK